jgi:uncharacterized membrane protein YfcA
MNYTLAALDVGIGLVIGVLSGALGAGPSILTLLLLTQVMGLELHHATATSLAVVAVMSLVALVHYAWEGAIVWRPAVGFGVASMSAAFVAGHLAARVPDGVLLGVFLAAMVVAALAMVGRPPVREAEPAGSGAAAVAVLAGSGLVVGALTGLLGLGGGFAVVPLLVVFARTPVRSAIGASLLVIAANTLAGMAGQLPHPPIDWPVAALLGGAEALGAVAGARLSRRLSHLTLRRAFAGLMVAAAVFLTVQSLLGPSHARPAAW